MASLEKRGWEVGETTLPPNRFSDRHCECPGWRLTSSWPPVGFQICLEVHKDRIVGPNRWKMSDQLCYGAHFEKDLELFVQGLDEIREDSRYWGRLTVMGVAPKDLRSEVESLHGEPRFEGKYYVRDWVGRYEYERVQCLYNEGLTVSYYLELDKLVVCQVSGQCLERDGITFVVTGDLIEPEHELLAREVAFHSPRPVPRPREAGWKYFVYQFGRVRIERGVACEFRLGCDSGGRGRRVD